MILPGSLEEGDRWDPADRTVRSFVVVEAMSFPDFVLRCDDVREVVLVKISFAQPAVETLDVAVLHRLAGINEVQVDVQIGSPPR